jgi:hypothetical protein
MEATDNLIWRRRTQHQPAAVVEWLLASVTEVEVGAMLLCAHCRRMCWSFASSGSFCTRTPSGSGPISASTNRCHPHSRASRDRILIPLPAPPPPSPNFASHLSPLLHSSRSLLSWLNLFLFKRNLTRYSFWKPPPRVLPPKTPPARHLDSVPSDRPSRSPVLHQGPRPVLLLAWLIGPRHGWGRMQTFHGGRASRMRYFYCTTHGDSSMRASSASVRADKALLGTPS